MANEGGDSQLPEKYHERALARRRGIHRTEFRNFTIVVPDQDESESSPLATPKNFENQTLNCEDTSNFGEDNSLVLEIEFENRKRLKTLDINDNVVMSPRESNITTLESAITAISNTEPNNTGQIAEIINDTPMLIDSPAISLKPAFGDAIRSSRTLAHNEFSIISPGKTARTSSVDFVDDNFDESDAMKTVNENDNVGTKNSDHIHPGYENKNNKCHSITQVYLGKQVLSTKPNLDTPKSWSNKIISRTSTRTNSQTNITLSNTTMSICDNDEQQFDDTNNNQSSSDNYESEGSIIMANVNEKSKVRSLKNKRNVKIVRNEEQNGITAAKSNEIKIINDVIKDTISEFLKDQNEGESLYGKEILNFKKEVESRILKQSDLVNEQITMRSSLRKARSRINQLNKEITCLQHKREKIDEDLSIERKAFKTYEQNRKKLEQIHGFLSDMEILRESVMSKDISREDDEVLDGFEGLLTSTTFKCCDVSYSVGAFDTIGRVPLNKEGNLATISQFNTLLEACEHIIRQSSNGG
ncbi:1579_t:CDS:2 [Acaulospora morrowiae]|uniref:1579_t:CDS:1 n=1 Tax=Acaulospora morrowiae TaxID=94023 RepID=A0A9N9DF79_9GLOM|nr:1579_t:CDS:2 [Acaulospora morrowiae]